MTAHSLAFSISISSCCLISSCALLLIANSLVKVETVGVSATTERVEGLNIVSHPTLEIITDGYISIVDDLLDFIITRRSPNKLSRKADVSGGALNSRTANLSSSILFRAFMSSVCLSNSNSLDERTSRIKHHDCSVLSILTEFSAWTFNDSTVSASVFFIVPSNSNSAEGI